MEKQIKVIKRFKDKKHNLILRKPNEVYTEAEERADFLITNGYVVLVADIIPEPISEPNQEAEKVEIVETALKEVKKEKAVKETKKVKKNAKK